MEVIFLRQAHHFIKKSNKSLKEKIKEEVFKIKTEPEIGRRLSGQVLKDIRSHRFIFSKTHYRIAYKVKDNVIIICIASRENFYRDLQK